MRNREYWPPKEPEVECDIVGCDRNAVEPPDEIFEESNLCDRHLEEAYDEWAAEAEVDRALEARAWNARLDERLGL
jgi:hypothetical protein